MKILTRKESDKQKAKQATKIKAEKICDAYVKGLTDYLHQLGYNGSYEDELESNAYDYAWNKMAKSFPQQ